MFAILDRLVDILLLIFVFIIPYQVDRPAKRAPYFTYALMGINIFIFLATVIFANVYLPADRIIGQRAITQLLAENSDGTTAIMPPPAAPAAGDEEDDGSKNSSADTVVKKLNQMQATIKASKKADTQDGYTQLWQIQHAYDKVVFEPHYSILNEFAYHPNHPTVWGLFGSMFLHFGIMHLVGNMLFLWVFGRALEDTLGPRIFVGAYLVCGLAAGLLHHIMTMNFAANQAGIPAAGASGAIAGVLGLFALRFYRTPVRTFFLLITGLIAFIIATFVSFIIWFLILREVYMALTLSALTAGVGVFFFGRGWGWGVMKPPSAWAIGIYLVVFDFLPAIRGIFSESGGGGVAHWAHIGGFLFGLLYALLIGSQEEGKAEFMLEDAQKALDGNDATYAITYAENILEREPNNGAAHEIIAKAHDKKNNEDGALDNYELAILKYLQSGMRTEAARLYLESLQKHPRFILDPATQLALGTQMAKEMQILDAAETLVKIPYTFPDAPEGEISLLRSAQLYLNQLEQPQMAIQLLTLFFQRYPESEWLPQAERAWKVASYQINRAVEEVPVEEPQPEPEPEVQAPRAPRAQAVLSSEIMPQQQ